MKSRNIKTIDVNSKQWMDKTYGNSYFSMSVVINYGLKSERSFFVPMQYGYGDYYKSEAFKQIQKRFNCFKAVKDQSYWMAYQKYNIIARHNKKENCLKKELKY